MIKLTIWNMKGGTGKSTISFNLANNLIMKGARVLVLDLDIQANLTSFFEKDIEKIKTNRADIARLVDEKIAITKGIYHSKYKGLDFIKGSNEIISCEHICQLKEMLKAVEDDYDFCLIDCHPDNSMESRNALVAADLVIVPVLLDGFSRDNLNLVTREIRRVEEIVDSDVEFKVVVNKLRNLKSQRDMYLDLAKNHDYPLMNTAITESAGILSALAIHKPLAQHRSKSNASNDFVDLTNEIFSIFGLEE